MILEWYVAILFISGMTVKVLRCWVERKCKIVVFVDVSFKLLSDVSAQLTLIRET